VVNPDGEEYLLDLRLSDAENRYVRKLQRRPDEVRALQCSQRVSGRPAK
jgi:hypothetical protein